MGSADISAEQELNYKMKSEVRALVEALERCLKTQSDFESTCKLTDKLKKQIASIKTNDDQREYVLQLMNEINDRGRETAELRAEQEALRKINRDQRKQWQQSASSKDTQKIQELQAATQELKATVTELKEKKQRAEMQLKDKEGVSAALEQKYNGLVALVSKAQRSGSKIDLTGPLPRGCDVEYLEKHIATLQHCKELDDKNHAALLQGAVSRLRENKAKVAKLEADLQEKEEEIRSNKAHLRFLKAQHRQHQPTLPPIQEPAEKKSTKHVRMAVGMQSARSVDHGRPARSISIGQVQPLGDHGVMPNVPHDSRPHGTACAESNVTATTAPSADPIPVAVASAAGAADAQTQTARASLGGVRKPAGDAPRAPSRKTNSFKQQSKNANNPALANNPVLAKQMAAEYVSQLINKCVSPVG
eukprot:GEMP01035455.1.p1 GENE.GEMP01035455.1~~GEMP01035455.1.p1  ORF type:complete len:426 (+),score=126.44 GEMP01035455.1:22-1278(+)